MATQLQRRARADIGWRPFSGSVMWGALGGLVASILIGFPMQSMMGALTGNVAALVGGDSLFVGWMLHLIAGLALGAVYGMFVRTRDLGRGFAYGLAYGLLVGVVVIWLGMNVLLGRAPPLDSTGAMQVGIHAMWGALLGLIVAWGVRASTPDTGMRRHAGRFSD